MLLRLSLLSPLSPAPPPLTSLALTSLVLKMLVRVAVSLVCALTCVWADVCVGLLLQPPMLDMMLREQGRMQEENAAAAAVEAAQNAGPMLLLPPQPPSSASSASPSHCSLPACLCDCFPG
jgi:hypothetical protein